MPDIIFEHRHIDGKYLIEMKIIRIKKDTHYPEGIKYSLVAIDRETGKRMLGFDNHEKRGHHLHRLTRELPYDFIDEWKLIEDFNAEYEKMRKRSK
jgi:hypothetical protein